MTDVVDCDYCDCPIERRYCCCYCWWLLLWWLWPLVDCWRLWLIDWLVVIVIVDDCYCWCVIVERYCFEPGLGPMTQEENNWHCAGNWLCQPIVSDNWWRRCWASGGWLMMTDVVWQLLAIVMILLLVIDRTLIGSIDEWYATAVPIVDDPWRRQI